MKTNSNILVRERMEKDELCRIAKLNATGLPYSYLFKKKEEKIGEYLHAYFGSTKKNFFISMPGKACIFLVPSEWDTEVFERTSARASFTFLEPQEMKYAEGLTDAFLDTCGKNKIKFVVASVNTRNVAFLDALIKRGFQVFSVHCKYQYSRRKGAPEIKPLYRTRPFREDDYGDLEKIVKTKLVSDKFGGHFNLDPHLGPDAIERLYSSWLRTAVSTNRDNLIVTENSQGEIGGFLLFSFDEILNKVSGIRVIGRGLTAVLDAFRGAEVSLSRAVFDITDRHFDFAEFDTQVYNYAMLKIWQYFRLKPVNSEYILHRWL